MADSEPTPSNQKDATVWDVWTRTLSQIPTSFGRIAYLASLRNENSGRYEHFGLASLYSGEEADRVLNDCHRRAFSEWLGYSLERQRDDLEEYLASIDAPRETVLSIWLDLAPYRNLIPTGATKAERRLYLSDLELILDLLRNELSTFS